MPLARRNALPNANAQLAVFRSRPIQGRTSELAALRERLHERGVTVLHGAPGVGKTRLLAELCFAETENTKTARTMVWATMRGAGEPALFHRIAEALGIGVLAVPESALRAECVRRLRQVPNYLLAIDNLDLPASALQQIAEIAIAAPNGHVLVSSRFAWTTEPDVRRIDVAPLSDDAIVAMLHQGFDAHSASEPVTDTQKRELSRLVAGLPLAAEVAVAMSTRIGVENTIERIRSNAVPDRLANSIRASIELLSASDCDVLLAASMLAPQFDATAIVALVRCSRARASEALERLVVANLAFVGGRNTFSLYPFVAETMRELKDSAPFRAALLAQTLKSIDAVDHLPLRARLPALLALQVQIERAVALHLTNPDGMDDAQLEQIGPCIEVLLVLAQDCHQKLDPSSVLHHPLIFPKVQRTPRYRLMNAEFAINGGRIDEAEALLAELAQDSQLSPLERQRVRFANGSVLWCRGDLPQSRIETAEALAINLGDSGGRRAALLCTHAIASSLDSSQPAMSWNEAIEHEALSLAANESLAEERLVRATLIGVIFARGEYEKLLRFAAEDPLTRLGLAPDFEVLLHSLYAEIHLNRLAEAARTAEGMLREASTTMQAARTRMAYLALALKRNHTLDIALRRQASAADVPFPPVIEAFRQSLVALSAIAEGNVPLQHAALAQVQRLVDADSPFAIYGQVGTRLAECQARTGTCVAAREEVDALLRTHTARFSTVAAMRGFSDLAMRICDEPLVLLASSRSVRFGAIHVDLSKRQALWAALHALADAHRNDKALSAAEIHAQAWPDDRSSSTARGNRVRVTLHYLKQLGLDCIESGRVGYKLRPQLPVWIHDA